jgi:hypothetical protein
MLRALVRLLELLLQLTETIDLQQLQMLHLQPTVNTRHRTHTIKQPHLRRSIRTCKEDLQVVQTHRHQGSFIIKEKSLVAEESE